MPAPPVPAVLSARVGFRLARPDAIRPGERGGRTGSEGPTGTGTLPYADDDSRTRGSPIRDCNPQGRGAQAAHWWRDLCTVVTGTGLTGCGSGDPDAGTNGVGKLPAGTIESQDRAAAKSASALRLSGTVVGNGGRYTLDMRLKSDGGTGSVTSRTGSFKVLRVGPHLFLKADAAFWNQEGPTAAAIRRPRRTSSREST